MGNPAVDEYVESRLQPWQREIVAELREVMRESAPEAAEVISSGSPAWRGAKILAIISPSKTHVTFAFERGAEFTDEHGLLEGSGRRTRHVKIKPGADVNRDALRSYIAQAVALDSA
ncbi:DUF1801 domain-containing protein [Bailinhaonella thermotolerans]|uniref:DUF1801 domain-containing protein n=1 Tax=Bailinhaonella thermotolerans TaxID=1070861 RepID=A0A3A4B5Y4_9ACTN|nr:DUF1801 domain-containing protein [Bailinhaonella thermotolerans]RJL36040.1 DUF1801 domain-containing protein [Bailinhaonella thermotolerans]